VAGDSKTQDELELASYLNRKEGKMNTPYRSILVVFALTIFSLLNAPVHAQFLYAANNGSITITGYTGAGGDASIPSTIDGLSVTTIGDLAFYASTNLTSVTIPDSVTRIGYAVFGAYFPSSFTGSGRTYCWKGIVRQA